MAGIPPAVLNGTQRPVRSAYPAQACRRYKLRVGRKTRSSAPIANAWDHRADGLCSLAVLIGLGIVRWGGEAWIGADEVAALVVVAAIIWLGAQLLRKR
jgi:divalent metal cation (Fe/Co/Zn/Cd) transporter